MPGWVAVIQFGLFLVVIIASPVMIAILSNRVLAKSPLECWGSVPITTDDDRNWYQ